MSRRCGETLTLVFLVVLAPYHVGHAGEAVVETEGLRAEFEARYQTWEQYIQDNPHLSTWMGREFSRIVALGPQAVPFMIEKLEEGPDYFGLSSAVLMICRKGFPRDEWPEGKLGGSVTGARMYVDWWRNRRHLTPQKFEALYSRWLTVRDSGDSEASKNLARDIARLGLDALPLLVEKIRDGDDRCVAIFSQIIFYGKAWDEDSPQHVIDWWEANREEWTLPPPGSAPVDIMPKIEEYWNSGDMDELGRYITRTYSEMPDYVPALAAMSFVDLAYHDDREGAMNKLFMIREATSGREDITSEFICQLEMTITILGAVIEQHEQLGTTKDTPNPGRIKEEIGDPLPIILWLVPIAPRITLTDKDANVR